jgi:hypothetical protein
MPNHASLEDEVERSVEELAKNIKQYLRHEEFKYDLRYLAKVLGFDIIKTFRR